MRFSFWYTWLLAASVFFAGFGILVAVAPDTIILTWWNQAVAQHFFDGTVPPRADAFGAFLLGPLGATISGFYVLQFFIVKNAFRRRERWAWWAIALATLVWFVVDSIRSLQHGAVFNVWMINVPALTVIALPLAMTWGDMHRSTEDVLPTS
ncbi:MAG: hypothetical protein GVY18_17140 [Bacteroidetes bacterium]|jgi:hypothetical protein|nr:hypothetical protein [Bacteroidota bacterium]